MLTKGKFLELLKSVDPDPGFLVMIVKECFSMLPDSVAWKLAHQVYMNYYYDGPTYKVVSILSGEELLFPDISNVTNYLNKLGYKVDNSKVSLAFRRSSDNFCNHKFFKAETEDKKKEITYFE